MNNTTTNMTTKTSANTSANSIKTMTKTSDSTTKTAEKTSTTKSTTGYVFEELFMWHHPSAPTFAGFIQPVQHWENSETKRRIHNLILASGLEEHLHRIRARRATEKDLERYHTKAYIQTIRTLSDGQGGIVGDETSFSKGAHEIACLAVGGGLSLLDAIMDPTNVVSNGYALLRPPGHHAVSDNAMGFCIYNNIVLAARYLQEMYPNEVQRIAIVDYDVHHGNGTQDAFWESNDVLFVSIHQDDNYPIGCGAVDDVGVGVGQGFTLNIPLPPGAGKGAYQATFERIVLPALTAFQPDFILVSSGFDAAYADPLGSMMLSSEDFRGFADALKKVAELCCQGRIAFFHEGGYSEIYVPFCALAVIESLSGVHSGITDPFLSDVQGRGYQQLQPHQEAVLDQVERNMRDLGVLLLPKKKTRKN